MRLVRPDQRLKLWKQQQQHLTQQLITKIRSDIELRRSRINDLVFSLRIHSPLSTGNLLRQQTDHFQNILQQAMQKKLSEANRKIEQLQSSIKILGPKTTLDRGYAIVLNKQGKVVTSPENVRTGEILDLKVSKGQFQTTVK